MTAAKIITVFAGFVGVIALAVYIFGIPPEVKRKMERTALKTMGENKMSYMAKDQISKVPDSDQRDLDQLKKGFGNAVGGLTQNPLGEATARAASQAWDSMQDYSKIARERVSTMTKNAVDAATRKASETTHHTAEAMATAMDKIANETMAEIETHEENAY